MRSHFSAYSSAHCKSNSGADACADEPNICSNACAVYGAEYCADSELYLPHRLHGHRRLDRFTTRPV